MRFFNENRIVKCGLTIILALFFISFFNIKSPAHADTASFKYNNDSNGVYIENGIPNGDTYNYNYGAVNGVAFDDEGYVNYSDKAYLKKSVQANASKQGLFDVTLDVKGNQVDHPVDIVLVIDFSSSMKGEKLTNALKGLDEFGAELKNSLQSGNIRVGIVAYNRYVYATDGLTGDISTLENFLKNTAESHAGTFVQKGMIEGKKLLDQDGRANAEHLLIHIGDGSANRSYLPVEGAPEYTNQGEITDYNNYHTDKYNKDFQVSSDAYNTSDKSGTTDAQGTLVDKSIVTDATLGTVVQIKESNINCYSIGVAPSDRGVYIAKNIASTPNNYFTIDENLAGLGEALGNIADNIDKTIPKGTITDPMGKDILLQGAGNFTPENYVLQGWRKNEDGAWEKADDVTKDIKVSEENNILTLENVSLGQDERITMTYHVHINTESADFKGETWYQCNGETTLDPESDTEQYLEFPVPSIKAPKVILNVEKQWINVATPLIPDSINFMVTRKNSTSDTWTKSDKITLSKDEGFNKTYETLPVNGVAMNLPVYNNNGDNFEYQVTELDIPEQFESSVTKDGNSFTIVNKLSQGEEEHNSTTETGSSSSTSTKDSSTSTSTSSTSDSKTPVTPQASSNDDGTNRTESSKSSISLSRSGLNTKTSASKKAKKALPKTGEKMDNMIVGGICLLLIGGIFYLYKKPLNEEA